MVVSCIFCTLPEIKQRMVVENGFAWAFLTNIPVVPGHTLVVPKRCVSSFSDLTSEEVKALFDLTSTVKSALRECFGAEGFNHAWNEDVDQSVSHFHLHVLPRKEGDAGVYGYDPRKFLYRPGSREDSPEEELVAVVKMIKQYL